MLGTVKDKVTDIDWQDNLEIVKDAGKNAFIAAKKAGNFVLEQSKPLMENIADKSKTIYNEIVKPESNIDLNINEVDDFRKKSYHQLNNDSYINEPFAEEMEKAKL